MKSNDIGTQRELFVDTHLIDSLTGHIHQHLHEPVDKGIVIDHDAPWEGTTCGYNSTLRVDDKFWMYYRGWDLDENAQKGKNAPVTCVAESDDGVHWTKPNLGLIEFGGSTDNNIILETDFATHNFVPFIDTNPNCDPSASWKGVGRGTGDQIRTLYSLHSTDGLNWTQDSPDPMPLDGKFDSQNIAYWDPNIEAYRIYFRDMERDHRAIRTAISPDFVEWTESTFLDYGDAADTHLYTNQIEPYFRAPHIYVGFPTRFMQDREAITEGLFMSSRDGLHFNRWEESFIRPGLNANKWGNRCNYTWYGLIETPSDIQGAPPEISIFTDEKYYSGKPVSTRRHTLRLDGFVSLRAGMAGGEVITNPMIFSGSSLEVNISTSAAGSMRVEVLDEGAKAIDGYSLEDSDEFFGDTVEHTVTWKDSSDVSKLEGQPTRLRFVLHDADVYSFKFK
jgi:hypothetical protein